jgi:5-oxoprolinase (ATP-hydrolysing)
MSSSASTTSTTTTTTTPGGGGGGGGDGRFHFAIDRGGTFTDVYCVLPNGSSVVQKLLSEDPHHYPDAPTEGIRRILQEFDTSKPNQNECYSRNVVIPTESIGSIRMGTTVATNALLERQGAKMALLITKGFEDVLEIGNQSRPDIFDLTCQQPGLLYETVVSVQERVLLTKFIDEYNLETENENDDYQMYPRVTGFTGEELFIVQTPNEDQVRRDLKQLQDMGITSLAIALLHAYTFPDHERQIAAIAESMNCFTHISCSSSVMPMVKLVPRGHTCCASAYLTPILSTYLRSFAAGFEHQFQEQQESEAPPTSNDEEHSATTVQNKHNNKKKTTVLLSFMKSDGGLAPMNEFGGHQAILSGPAGGVVGYAKTTYNPQYASSSSPSSSTTSTMPLKPPVIGFDMGGTSTDVSRYDGHHMEHVFETVTAGVAIQA